MTLSFGDLRISINIHDLYQMERNKEIQTEYKDIIAELSTSDEELEEDFSECWASAASGLAAQRKNKIIFFFQN